VEGDRALGHKAARQVDIDVLLWKDGPSKNIMPILNLSLKSAGDALFGVSENILAKKSGFANIILCW
jgi:hypothetical protein